MLWHIETPFRAWSQHQPCSKQRRCRPTKSGNPSNRSLSVTNSKHWRKKPLLSPTCVNSLRTLPTTWAVAHPSASASQAPTAKFFMQSHFHCTQKALHSKQEVKPSSPSSGHSRLSWNSRRTLRLRFVSLCSASSRIGWNYGRGLARSMSFVSFKCLGVNRQVQKTGQPLRMNRPAIQSTSGAAVADLEFGNP